MTESQTVTSYRVTHLGYQQIVDWMIQHYKPAAWDRLVTLDDVARAVCAWAAEAEESQNGELEMSAHWTQSGRIEYLTPEREAITTPEAL